jgi:hypothetical protein
LATSGLAFDGADVAAENSMGIYSVLPVDGTVGKGVPVQIAEEVFELGTAD